MFGLPPGATIGVKPPSPRDYPQSKPEPEQHFIGHDLGLTAKEMRGAEKIKIAWAEQVADAPVMLMGRDERGRFVSLKGKAK